MVHRFVSIRWTWVLYEIKFFVRTHPLRPSLNENNENCVYHLWTTSYERCICVSLAAIIFSVVSFGSLFFPWLLFNLVFFPSILYSGILFSFSFGCCITSSSTSSTTTVCQSYSVRLLLLYRCSFTWLLLLVHISTNISHFYCFCCFFTLRPPFFRSILRIFLHFIPFFECWKNFKK